MGDADKIADLLDRSSSILLGLGSQLATVFFLQQLSTWATVVILVFSLGNSFTSAVVIFRRLVPVLEYSLKLLRRKVAVKLLYKKMTNRYVIIAVRDLRLPP